MTKSKILNKNEFFACWMESDGLATVKNKGRQDVYNKWSAIEDKWVDIVMKQSGEFDEFMRSGEKLTIDVRNMENATA